MTKLNIEVAYATPAKQKIIEMVVDPGTTALDAARQSNIQSEFPEIEIDNYPMGIFGNAFGARGMATADEYILAEGDRIEIYRPLIADPKEVRKQRAAEAAARKQAEKERSPAD